jgi:hypothetical protein
VPVFGVTEAHNSRSAQIQVLRANTKVQQNSGCLSAFLLEVYKRGKAPHQPAFRNLHGTITHREG